METAGLLERIAPGITTLKTYRRDDVRYDLVAGVSVAAVALPVGVAYAELAGFNPAVGLYSSILPLLAYALFGSSRQLIVGPDAATCALVAAAVAPLAGGDAEQYQAMSVTLAFLAGLLAIAASFLKLGALADFLSRPILSGLMNGIALSIVLGQLGKLFGFEVTAGRIVPRLVEVVQKLPLTHVPTFAVGLGSLVVYVLSKRWLKRLPAALVVMVLAGFAVALLGLDARGVRVVGDVPAGLPRIAIPQFSLATLESLFGSAAGVALVSFASAMLTARAFAAKNGYEIDANRDLAAVGASNVAAALSQGFAVSGADSRTAMNDASGGRTRVTGLFAAAVVALVVFFLTAPLKYVPVPALGAVLVMAAYSLVDVASLRTLYREDKTEFVISVVAMLGVVAIGSIHAILLAVVLALVRFIRIVAQPRCEVLGEVPGLKGFHGIERHPQARTIPGLCLFRFSGPVVFFNALYFKSSALKAAAAAGPELEWFVVDAGPITSVDVTGRHAFEELERELRARHVTLVFAARKTEIDARLQKLGLSSTYEGVLRFPTLRQAVRAFAQKALPGTGSGS
ncbi:MAG TPA: SulP family inorganic anion transporter [Polyangiaceae bacterium]